MQCPNCEAENRDEAKFCDECGFPLSGSIARVGGAASPKGASGQDSAAKQRFDWMPLDERPAEPEPAREDELAQPSGNGFGDGFADFAEPAGYDAFEPADDTQAYGYVPVDDIPMADIDYEASTWRQAQSATQAIDAVQGQPPYFEDAPSEGATPDSARGEWPGDNTMEMPRVGQERPVQSRDYRITTQARGRRNAKLAAFIVAGIAVGAVVAALVTYALGFWGGSAVPDVTGMTEADARTALEGDGFSVRTTQVKSDDTEGLVLIMDPGAGSRAPEGSEVVIHIATARFVPEVIGKSAEEAKALLAEAGYENVRYEMQKSDESEDVVLDVAPEEGTRAKSSTEIVVKVSEAYTVPSVEGLDVDSAIATVTEAGLSPEVVYIDTDQFPDGSIIGTNPEAGTKVSSGDYVSISVARARGVELVGLTEQMLAEGNTVTIGGVDYEIETLISVSYQGDDTVAFSATGRPKITFFGETLYASSSQTISGMVAWSEDNEVIGIS